MGSTRPGFQLQTEFPQLIFVFFQVLISGAGEGGRYARQSYQISMLRDEFS